MFSKFKQKAKTVSDCQYGMYHYFFEKCPYVLIFKTTNYCWYNCTHCCENAGSHNQRNFMSESVIKGIIDQACADKDFSRMLVFTGGELMSAYKYADKNYVSNLINHALDNGCAVDIKTNAGWIDFPFANQIFQDIENVVQKHANADDNDGTKKLLDFQVSLSLDRYHKNALDNDFKFIEHFANTDIPGIEFHIHLNSFKWDRDMFDELMQRLAKSGIEISELTGYVPGKTVTLYNLNQNVVVNYTETVLFDGGRAKNTKNTHKPVAPEFNFIGDDLESLVAFDSFGNVTLGENFDANISTPWRNDDKSVKTLETIKTDLSNNIKQAEQNFLQQHQNLNRCFSLARKVFTK